MDQNIHVFHIVTANYTYSTHMITLELFTTSGIRLDSLRLYRHYLGNTH
jgi:hypothetical protein